MWRRSTTLSGGFHDAASPATPQASPGGKAAAVQSCPHPPEKSWAPQRSALHHRQPPYPCCPVGGAGPLYRPPGGPDGAQGASRHDCSAGLRAFPGDPRHGPQRAVAIGGHTRSARDRPVRFAPLWLALLPETITRTIVSLHARFRTHFADRLLVDLLHALIREFRVAFARRDGRVPQQFLDRDHLGPSFQEVGREGMPQTVTAGLDAGRLGIPLHLFLYPFGGQGPMRAFLIPKDHIVGHHRGP